MNAYHAERYKPYGTLLDHHAKDLEAAKLAFERLLKALQGRSRTSRYAAMSIMKFSVYGNLLIESDDDRRELGVTLAWLMAGEMAEERRDKAAKATREFLFHRDPSRLLGDLRATLAE